MATLTIPKSDMVEQEPQNQLNLVLKKQYFLEILEGKKTEEYGDFTEYFIRKLCTLDDKGEITGCRKYDTVRFQMGYNKDAPHSP